MKTVLLATTAIFLGAVSANAADLAARTYTKAAPMLAPSWNWSGFYIGGNVGYGATESPSQNAVFTPTTPLTLVAASVGTTSAQGIVGGGQIGWNTMVMPGWLIGIEADFQGSDQNGSTSVILGGATAPTATVESRLNWFGTVRGRVGWTATPETLLYVTGGYAYGEVETRNSSNFPSGGVPFLAGSAVKNVQDGWTVGGGVETRLWNTNWTGKLEYLYMDLGTQRTGNSTGPAGSGFVQGSLVDFNDHVIRVGLNYKLGAWAY